MTADGLDPPGEQLALFPEPELVETTRHRTLVHGVGTLVPGASTRWWWACTCGGLGPNTTQGHAEAGRKRHLRAVRRRIDRP